METARPRASYFGAAGRELFGILHPGHQVDGRRMAVLLCSPFGLEAIRAQRTWRVLAERLARAGHSVLRFDYFGSGDSDGDDADVALEGIREDIEAASQMLRSTCPGLPTVWIGLGLGATAALAAARIAAQPPDRLLLWEPVIDGRGYLETLRQRQAELIETMPQPTHRKSVGTVGFEALGFSISPRLEGEIAKVSAETLLPPPPATHMTLLTQPDDALAKVLVARLQASTVRVEHVEQKHAADWMAETADAGTLVPGAAVLKLAALLRNVP